jgi:hypothetical protein
MIISGIDVVIKTDIDVRIQKKLAVMCLKFYWPDGIYDEYTDSISGLLCFKTYVDKEESDEHGYSNNTIQVIFDKDELTIVHEDQDDFVEDMRDILWK